MQERKGELRDLSRAHHLFFILFEIFSFPFSLTLLAKSGLGIPLWFVCDLTRTYFKVGEEKFIVKGP